MGDLAALLTAIGTLITAIGATTALLINSLRTSRRERSAAADDVLDRLRAAAEDGVITVEEIAEIMRDEEDGDDR
ncbi:MULTISPECIES: hypothetical protein [unclassified Crossiella]|uniref:hypothetical protein n=1 Tax=unclassified Crossiella TaxID=2620835 RepID=UPI001FFF37E9|nr:MULTISPECIES: hypothetical protein [unclassified Crossiella]MCK2242138.1 hypothetical protein [Crossiella sp. S99.2]MCK2256041.1 hypothetical protein [Crossiella sp. S99.1]